MVSIGRTGNRLSNTRTTLLIAICLAPSGTRLWNKAFHIIIIVYGLEAGYYTLNKKIGVFKKTNYYGVADA